VELVQALDSWLASLHPDMAGVSSLQCVSVLLISWFGCRAICGPRQADEPSERTLADVKEILRRAKRR
jgi:hypothetical protein